MPKDISVRIWSNLLVPETWPAVVERFFFKVLKRSASWCDEKRLPRDGVIECDFPTLISLYIVYTVKLFCQRNHEMTSNYLVQKVRGFPVSWLFSVVPVERTDAISCLVIHIPPKIFHDGFWCWSVRFWRHHIVLHVNGELRTTGLCHTGIWLWRCRSYFW